MRIFQIIAKGLYQIRLRSSVNRGTKRYNFMLFIFCTGIVKSGLLSICAVYLLSFFPVFIPLQKRYLKRISARDISDCLLFQRIILNRRQFCQIGYLEYFLYANLALIWPATWTYHETYQMGGFRPQQITKNNTIGVVIFQ